MDHEPFGSWSWSALPWVKAKIRFHGQRSFPFLLAAMSEPSRTWSTEALTPVSQLRTTVLVVALLALSGYVDWSTGFEVSVFLLYTVPVGLATRTLGLAAGLLCSVAAMGIWVLADVQSGHVYSQQWFVYVNALNRLACFVLTVLAVSYLGAKYRRLTDKLQAFSGEIPQCTQCHRLSAPDGHWRSVEQHFAEFGGAHLRHKACPDCARRGYARAAYAADQADAEATVDSDQTPHTC
jgi:hypothetical protein